MEKIEQKALKFIAEKRLIDKGDKILVALSGGPDSVFLTHFLKKYAKKLQIEIGAVHINHMIRGKSALEDEAFCQELSLNLGFKLFSVRRKVREYSKKRKISVEEAGRIIRYAEFNNAIKKFGASKLATAHNCSDNAETVLLNLIKGTGLKGISGIPVRRDKIIRPILNLKKDEILEYLNKNRIEYRIDESNLKGNYERNFLRLNIIPLIKDKLNPDIESALFNSSENFRNALSFILKNKDAESEETFDFINDELRFNIKKFGLIDEELKSHYLKNAIEYNFNIQVTFEDIKNLIQLSNKESGKKINLSNNLTAFNERESIRICRNKKKEKFEAISLHEGEEVKINGSKFSIELYDKIPGKFLGNRLKEYISADKLTGNFILRRWKAGDKFVPFGFKGTKKISDFLNEHKVPTSKKEEQLVLTYRGKIVWVLGLRIDDSFRITNNTKKVFELCLK